MIPDIIEERLIEAIKYYKDGRSSKSVIEFAISNDLGGVEVKLDESVDKKFGIDIIPPIEFFTENEKIEKMKIVIAKNLLVEEEPKLLAKAFKKYPFVQNKVYRDIYNFKKTYKDEEIDFEDVIYLAIILSSSFLQMFDPEEIIKLEKNSIIISEEKHREEIEKILDSDETQLSKLELIEKIGFMSEDLINFIKELLKFYNGGIEGDNVVSFYKIDNEYTINKYGQDIERAGSSVEGATTTAEFEEKEYDPDYSVKHGR